VVPGAGVGVGSGRGGIEIVGSGRIGVGVGVGVEAGVGVEVGGGVAVGVGFGDRDGVGAAVGAGVGAGVSVGIGSATLRVIPIVGNVPEPHFGSPLEPGWSNAWPVRVSSPTADAVPVIVKTAASPAGSPTSGLSSVGFLNVARTPPLIGAVDACHRWTAANVWPLTETIATAETASDDGTST